MDIGDCSNSSGSFQPTASGAFQPVSGSVAPNNLFPQTSNAFQPDPSLHTAASSSSPPNYPVSFPASSIPQIASSFSNCPSPPEPLHLGVPNQIVTLKTGDGSPFKTTLMAMRHSNLYMRNAFLPNGETKKDFLVADVSGGIFGKVLEWCQHFPDVPHMKIEVDPHTQERRWFMFTQFHQDYFNIDMEDLEELIAAADYLQIQSLYLYACQAAAGRLKGKTSEEIREILGMTDDLTEEEKEAIRRDNVWCNFYQ